MQTFDGKVAVITGGASGIGLGVAQRCAQEGMKIVLADVEEGALAETARHLHDAGADVLPVRTDVSNPEEVATLARKTIDAFGTVHLLFNNAGVAAGGTIWESSDADWTWVMNVNLWGVIHGIRTFVPLMLDLGTEGHVVNTASIAGLLPHYHSAPYQVTKHAVVALTEQLHYSLLQRGARIRASVLCPGWVQTRILESERNRPTELLNTPGGPMPDEALVQELIAGIESGLAPAAVADHLFDAIREERLYVLTHSDWNDAIRQRFEQMVADDGIPAS